MNNNFNTIIDIIICSLFILSLRGLTFPRTAYRSNLLGIIGLCLAIIFSFSSSTNLLLIFIAISIGALIGSLIAIKIPMTSLPQTIAAFNGLGGLSAFLIATCSALILTQNSFNTALSALIGIFTFTGSFIAFAKLHSFIKKNYLTNNNYINLILFIGTIIYFAIYCYSPSFTNFLILNTLTALLGITITIRIGGADMPIVISLLNACSGLASSAIGFILSNPLLIITGALIGISGCILSYIMCKAMNRNLLSILFFPPLAIDTSSSVLNTNHTIKTGSPSEAAFIMENSQKIIIIPGYGMAVAQAQHSLKTMAEILSKDYNAEVKFAIHPVAGRMPGHMNVLLAEANVPYDNIYELNDINNEFSSTDVVYIIGANDITNPNAKNNPSSPIYGMPVFDVSKAKTVFVVKRSLATGYAGVENPLFYADNTIMLFGDAKQITSEIIKNLEHK